ncbi:unnamed protein product [Rhizophagus irregularis]|nr:unnamed protein product [Rhizophagus irregularis]
MLAICGQRMAAPEGGPNAIPYITSTSCLFIRRNLQYIQFKVALPKLEINVKFVQGDDPEGFIGLIDETKLYILNLGYPKLILLIFQILKQFVRFAHDAEIPVTIDNTSGAGKLIYYYKPIEHGADIVHGIGGHGTTIKVNLLGTFGYNSFTI